MTARPRGSQAIYWPIFIEGISTWNNSAATSFAVSLLMGFDEPVLMSIKLQNDNSSRIRTDNNPVSIHLKSITNDLLLGIWNIRQSWRYRTVPRSQWAKVYHSIIYKSYFSLIWYSSMLFVFARRSYWLLEDVKLPYTHFMIVVDGLSGKL